MAGKTGKLMIINYIENRKRSGRYVKYPTSRAFCIAILTCITNAWPKCTQQSFHWVLVDYQKKRKKASIQGHQILGCKCTPAKGMESCEKNEQCKLVALYYSSITTTITTTTTTTSSTTSSWDLFVENKLFHWSIDSKQLD